MYACRTTEVLLRGCLIRKGLSKAETPMRKRKRYKWKPKGRVAEHRTATTKALLTALFSAQLWKVRPFCSTSLAAFFRPLMAGQGSSAGGLWRPFASLFLKNASSASTCVCIQMAFKMKYFQIWIKVRESNFCIFSFWPDRIVNWTFSFTESMLEWQGSQWQHGNIEIEQKALWNDVKCNLTLYFPIKKYTCSNC